MKTNLLLFFILCINISLGIRPLYATEIADYHEKVSLEDCEEESEWANAQFKDIVCSVYPNPASTEITINFSQQNTICNCQAKIIFFNLVGKKVAQRKIKVINRQVRVGKLNLEEGLYFVQVQMKDKYEIVKVFISNH